MTYGSTKISLRSALTVRIFHFLLIKSAKGGSVLLTMVISGMQSGLLLLESIRVSSLGIIVAFFIWLFVSSGGYPR